MRRNATARSLCLVLLGASAVVGQEDAPPLSAPAVGALAPAELPPVLESEPLADEGQGPVLAVPGLAIPGGGAPPAVGAPPASNDLPPLVGPAESPRAGSTLAPWSGSDALPGRGPRPLTLETIPEGSGDPLPRPSRSLDPSRRRDFDAPPPSAPRRFRLFGRWQPPPFLRGRGPEIPDETLSVEPRPADPDPDPASDAALKRRIESQVRTAVGSRLRSFDVRVVDRAVTIQARVNRFWYRRSVKRTLESLPALTGYRATIDVVD